MSFPLGPYHPALAQPFSLTVKLRGETMDAMDPPRTGYCARTVEVFASGNPLMRALALVERSCALAGHTHRTAACQAVERALQFTPSRHASLLRAAFAEIERMLARLWTLGMCARAVSLDVLWREALEQRETLFAALYQATGERCFWGIAVPGGVRRFDPELDDRVLLDTLARMEPELAMWRVATGARGPLGLATEGAGILGAERARDLAVMGITAHAAGLSADLRRDSPDDAYAAVVGAWPAEGQAERTPTPTSGDAAARLGVAADDLATSARLAQALLEAARDASDTPDVLHMAGIVARWGDMARDVEGSATREGPHGPVTLTLAPAPGGGVDRLSLRTPVAGVLAALPEMLRGQPVARAPLIVASADLCLECLDL